MQIPTIDLSQVETETEESRGFVCMPAGVYRVLINSAEYRETKAKTGHRLVLEFTVMGGDHDGRRMFEGINVLNDNPVAQEIGQRVLASLTDALGLSRDGLTDTDQLVDAVVNAEITCNRVKDETQREMYGDKHGRQNGVRAFQGGRKAEASAPPATAAPLRRELGDGFESIEKQTSQVEDLPF